MGNFNIIGNKKKHFKNLDSGPGNILMTSISSAVNIICKTEYSKFVKSMKDGKTNFFIYLDFHSTKPAPRLVDSWSRAPDQIQMYLDWDTISQLLPAQDVLL